MGVKAPALYKHVGGIGDLQHRIATLVMTELGDAERAPGQVRGGRDRRAIHGAPVLHTNYGVYEFSEGVTHVKLVFQDQAFSFELLRVVCKV